ncbi:MAG: hypothetical protein JO159_15835 [Acidobacteria bacterium]|nr:hypothetical protein [Acidobacteriota bacterium]
MSSRDFRRPAPQEKAQLMSACEIERIEKVSVPVGSVRANSYSDDLPQAAKRAAVPKTEIGFAVTGKRVVLVDDTLYTGKKARAASEMLFRHGCPQQVSLWVLTDRGRRELPIGAAYVGRRDQDRIELLVGEVDKSEKVLLMEMAL